MVDNSKGEQAYKANLISTIVDDSILIIRDEAYKANLISTIVDLDGTLQTDDLPIRQI